MIDHLIFLKHRLSLPGKYLSLYLATSSMLKSPKEAGAHGEDGDEQEKNHQGKQDSGMGLTAR